MTDQKTIDLHTTPIEIPIYRLNVTEPFKSLTEKEKLYAHHFSQACWWGSKVCLGQTSEESPVIFALLQQLFSIDQVPELKSKLVPSIISLEDFNAILYYSCLFYSNMGNYLSFGDSKFIPRINKDKFQLVINSLNDSKLTLLWNKCSELMYSLKKNELELGIDGTGVSTYYNPGITKDEIKKVQDYMNSVSLSAYNTRLFKVGQDHYKLLLASAETKPTTTVDYQGTKIDITYGDWSASLAKVAHHLEQALPYAANENQSQMIKKYVDHFKLGDINDHMESQKYWIKDVGPVVETNIGFIESYRDPFGVRGEFEGFVAIVNKELTAKLGKLIDNAETFIAQLPWNKTTKAFEREKFIRPDFTSLEVLTFASTGVPLGINIPNYDSFKEIGFKNVSLGNVLAARKKQKENFLRDEDQDLYSELFSHAFEVQVALHELLGHGSGKLVQVDANGKLNIDPETINVVTGKKIDPQTEAYKVGETYDSKFENVGSMIEENRAEAVALSLSLSPAILSLFGYTGQKAEDITYIMWLIMAKAGLSALEFYSPPTSEVPEGRFRQAHMGARYALFNVFLKSKIISLNVTEDDVIVTLDRSKIKTVGIDAVNDFLTKVNVYKATGNVTAARALFKEYQPVDQEFLRIRDIVLAKKKPRAVLVQSHTYIKDGQVILEDFSDNCEGLIQSMQKRFGTDNSDLGL
ncbi:hypothetical protein CYY_006462 [Polysphondylium violaceum]|uniref:Dipeptidyl peptidase 3 n=1 Tax=Polysphondylium violaceum TaxID=133409 RepID=A0A8J4PRU9_9MYCE|nr:hypothetical protein CYY_006462 [Polysphondylium violaceum]